MVLAMSPKEREAFLAGVHVGVLGVSRAGRGPLTVPVWYRYEPGGSVSVVTGGTSLKAHLIADSGRFSLCAQSETPPYQYVTVEGPVISTEAPVGAAERAAVAHRYLGTDVGDLYLAATEDRAGEMCVIRMRPEHWLTADFAKEFGA